MTRKQYRWTQEDHTPAIDGLANELGATREYRSELNQRLQHFVGYDWDNPTAREICKELDDCDKTIKELEQEIEKANADYLKGRGDWLEEDYA